MTTKTLLFLGSIFLCTIKSFAADVSSAVTEVTLFQDRAEIVRQATASLQSGKNALVIAPVPDQVVPSSLQVAGRGLKGVSIIGVQLKTRIREKDVSPERSRLEDLIEEKKEEQNTLKREEERLERERQLIFSVALDRTVPTTTETVLRPRSAEEMQKVLDFVSNKAKSLDQRLNALQIERKEIRNALSRLRQELNQLGQGKKKETIIEVLLDSPQPNTATLEIAYQVPGAAWRPMYNLQYQSAEQERFELETYGLIHQTTGEDWNDVQLTLSTARPHLGIHRPSIAPRYLQVREQRTRGKNSLFNRYATEGFGAAADTAMEAVPQKALAPQAASDKANFIEQQAHVQTGTVLSYQLPSKVTIKSDGSKEKYKVTSTTLTGDVRYITVPSRIERVFREGKVTNSSETPILPGELHVFADGQFLGKQHLPFIAPGREFDAPLGASDDFVVKRKLVKEFEEDSGVIRAFQKIQRDYEIEIEYLKKQPKKLIVLDAGPVSKNEKITATIENVEPDPLDADDKERLDSREGILEWHVSIANKETRKLRYSTTIEYKEGLEVTGL